MFRLYRLLLHGLCPIGTLGIGYDRHGQCLWPAIAFAVWFRAVAYRWNDVM
jgi:hypothetical protein